LWQPFDFEDDGNLVYAPPTESIGARVAHVTERTVEDFTSRGPFRPVYWAYFEANYYFFGTNPVGWRIVRLTLLLLSAYLLIAWLSDLGIAPPAAAAAALVGLLAPLRGSIWYRLGFGEAIAVPFMLLAFWATTRARCGEYPSAQTRGQSPSWLRLNPLRTPLRRGQSPFLGKAPRRWDCVAFIGLLAAVLTKNVFVAAVPAAALLRVWPHQSTWRESLRRHWRSAAVLSLVVLVPVFHLGAFAAIVEHKSEYTLSLPTWRHLVWMLRSVALSCGIEFLGIGLAVTIAGVAWVQRARQTLFGKQSAIAVGLLLLAGGIVVYLPALGQSRPAGRYTVPAACGGDVLLAVLLSAIPAIGVPWVRRMSWTLLAAGGAALVVVHFHLEIEFIGRCTALAESTRWLSTEAPIGATVRVASGALSAGEIVHLRAHLAGSNRGDLAVVANDAAPAHDRPTLLLTRAGLPAPADCVPVARFAHPFAAWHEFVASSRKRGYGVEIWRSDATEPPVHAGASGIRTTAAAGQENVH
jgi:hypothetical protein